MKRLGVTLLVIGLSFSAWPARADWSPAKRLTLTPDESRYPALAIDSSDAIHIVWSEVTPGNTEIHYRKSGFLCCRG